MPPPPAITESPAPITKRHHERRCVRPAVLPLERDNHRRRYRRWTVHRECRMRYFFRLTDGKDELNPHQGIELLGNAAAREEALRFAREIKTGKALPGRTWDGWFIRIVDQHGREIDIVPFDAVPDAPAP